MFLRTSRSTWTRWTDQLTFSLLRTLPHPDKSPPPKLRMRIPLLCKLKMLNPFTPILRRRRPHLVNRSWLRCLLLDLTMLNLSHHLLWWLCSILRDKWWSLSTRCPPWGRTPWAMALTLGWVRGTTLRSIHPHRKVKLTSNRYSLIICMVEDNTSTLPWFLNTKLTLGFRLLPQVRMFRTSSSNTSSLRLLNSLSKITF